MSYLQKRMKEKAAQRRHDRVKVLEILAGGGQRAPAEGDATTKAPTTADRLATAA